MSPTSILLSLFAASSTVLAQSVAPYDTPCAVLGPDFPAPSNPASSTAIKNAIQNATVALNAALTSESIYGQLDANTTSFSLSWFSSHENKAFFNYEYSAPVFAHPTEGVATVDNKTIYALGSVSKILEIYTWVSARPKSIIAVVLDHRSTSQNWFKPYHPCEDSQHAELLYPQCMNHQIEIAD